MTGILDIASSKVGMNATNAALKDFLYNGGQNLDPATRAWCADFVNATLRDSGQQGTNSGMARSFLNYGTPVETPQKGDIAVFSRGDPNGPQGHVAFYEGEGPGGIRVLGGNQGADRSVNYSTFPRERLLGFRRPGGSGEAGDSGQASQMPAYPWSPGANQQAQQANQLTGAGPGGPPMSQQPQRQLSFAELGQFLGIPDPPPLMAPPPFRPPFMAPSQGPFSFRRA